MDSPRGRIHLMRLGLEGSGRARRRVRAAHRHLPRLHGVRHGLPVGRAVRQADRGDAAAGGAPAPRDPGPTACSGGSSSACFPIPAGCAWRRSACGRTSAAGCSGWCARAACWRGCPPACAPWKAWRRRFRCARRGARGRRTSRLQELPASGWGCCSAASSASSSPASTTPPARTLAAEGCDVVVPKDQGCCGALMLHSGLEQDAAWKARKLIDAFDGADVDTIVINAAGCGSTLKEYGHLLRDDPYYAPSGQRPSPRSARTSRRCSPSWSRGRRATRSRCGSRITTPATCSTRRA